MDKRRRIKAWNRWLICKAGFDWLRYAMGDGDWYWMPSEQYAELSRRGFIDYAGRVTTAGRRAISKEEDL